MTQTQTLTLRASVDPSPGGPKLLIKISDTHVNIEHLAEVSLVSDSCSRLTIVGLYAGLDEGDVVISERLATAMDILDGDKVMLTTSTMRREKAESPSKPRPPVRHSPVVKPVAMPAPKISDSDPVTTLVGEEKRSIGNLLLDPVNVSQGMEGAVSRISLMRKIRTLVPFEADGEDLVDTEIGRTVGPIVDAWLVGDLTSRQLSVEIADLIEAKISCEKTKTSESPLSTLVGGRPNLAVAEELMNEVLNFRTREETFERALHTLLPKVSMSTGHFIQSDGNRFVHACNSNFRRLHAKLSDEMRLEILRSGLRLVKGASSAEPGRANVLTDREVLEELECDDVDTEIECDLGKLETFNARMDVYLLRLLRLKATAVDQVANLQEMGAYAVLGLSFGASEADVKKAYKKLAVLLHPDKGGNTEMFQQLTEAYDRVLNSLGVKKNPAQDEEVGNFSPTSPKQPQPSGAPDSARGDDQREEEEVESEIAGDERTKQNEQEEEELWDVVRGVVLAAQKAALMASEGLETSQTLSELASEKMEIRRNFQACVIACSAAVQAVSLVGMGALEAAKLALELDNFKNSECIAVVTEVSECGVDTVNGALQCRKDLETAETEKRLAFGESEIAVLKNIGRRVALGVGEAVRKALETAKVCEELYRWKTAPEKKEDKRMKTAMEQRKQNIELLRRLNAELLAFQDQINEAISKNHLSNSSSAISVSEKTSVFLLLRDYLFQSCVRLARGRFESAAEALQALQKDAAFACLFATKANTRLAVPISAAVRTLRLATVTDAEMSRRLVISALVDPLKSTLDRTQSRVFQEQVLIRFFN